MTVRPIQLLFLLALSILAGCVTPGTYHGEAYQLEGGCIVLFDCRVEDYSAQSGEGAKNLAAKVVAAYFAQQNIANARHLEALKVSFSEGYEANVLLVVGSEKFVQDWKSRGAYAAGVALAQIRQLETKPILTFRGKLTEP